MTIPRFDFFDFLFNNWRGIKADQVDWSVADPDLVALLAMVSGSGNTSYVGTHSPDDANGFNGDVYLRTQSGDIFVKESGAWAKQFNFSDAVQALIIQYTEPFAIRSESTSVPAAKLPVLDWAIEGNTAIIPNAKLPVARFLPSSARPLST